MVARRRAIGPLGAATVCAACLVLAHGGPLAITETFTAKCGDTSSVFFPTCFTIADVAIPAGTVSFGFALAGGNGGGDASSDGFPDTVGGAGALATVTAFDATSLAAGSALRIRLGAGGVSVPFTNALDTSSTGGGGSAYMGGGSGGGMSTLSLVDAGGAAALMAVAGGGGGAGGWGYFGGDAGAANGDGFCGGGGVDTTDTCVLASSGPATAPVGGGGASPTSGGASANDYFGQGTAGAGGNANTTGPAPPSSGGGGGGVFGGGAGASGPGGAGASIFDPAFFTPGSTTFGQAFRPRADHSFGGAAEASLVGSGFASITWFGLGTRQPCGGAGVTFTRNEGYTLDGAAFNTAGSVALADVTPDGLTIGTLTASAADVGAGLTYFVSADGSPAAASLVVNPKTGAVQLAHGGPASAFASNGVTPVVLNASAWGAYTAPISVTFGAYSKAASCIATTAVSFLVVPGAAAAGAWSDGPAVAGCPVGYTRASPTDKYCYALLTATTGSVGDAAAACAAQLPSWRAPALASVRNGDELAAVTRGTCGAGSWMGLAWEGAGVWTAADAESAAFLADPANVAAATDCSDNGDGSISTFPGSLLALATGAAGAFGAGVQRDKCWRSVSAGGHGYVGARIGALPASTPLYACCEALYRGTPPVPSGLVANPPPEWSDFSATGAFNVFVPPRGPVSSAGDTVFVVSAADRSDPATPAGKLTYALVNSYLNGGTWIDPALLAPVFAISPDATTVTLVGDAGAYNHKTVSLVFAVTDGLGAAPVLGNFTLSIVVSKSSPAGLPPTAAPPPFPFSGVVGQCVSLGGVCKVVASNRKNTPATSLYGNAHTLYAPAQCARRTSVVSLRFISWVVGWRFRRWYAITALPSGETAPQVLAYALVKNRYEVAVDLGTLVSSLPQDVDRVWIWGWDHTERVWRPVQAVTLTTPCH